MPPEPKAKSLKRRTSRREQEEFRFDGGHARELELKRSRGEVSCAECRRLKIKCDKQIPCTSCQRRGCAALCPNGSLATGQGTRFVLAATEHLHKRIARLSTRVRQLEDALASIHSKYAPEDQQPHPLLEREWNPDGDGADDDDELEPGSNRGRKIGKLPPGMRSARAISMGADDLMEESTISASRRKSHEGGEVIDAFGTLSISDHGISRFFGPTGGSESLLISSLPSSDSSPSMSSNPLRNSSSPATASAIPPNFEPDSSVSPSTTHSSHITIGTACGSNTTQTSATSVSSSSTADPRLTLFSHHFPFTPLALPPPQIQALIESYLPSYERAKELVNVYYSQVAWIFRGVSREQLDGEMLGTIYTRIHARERGEESTRYEEGYESDEGFVKQGQRDPSQSRLQPEDRSGEDYSGPHDLALLFIVFAVGALVEPTISPPPSTASQPNSPSHSTNSPATSPPNSASAPAGERGTPSRASKSSPAALAEHYHQLSRAALSLQAVLEKPSIVTIQTLHLLSIYNAMSGEGTAASTPSSSASTPGADGGEGVADGSGAVAGSARETSMEMTWSLITMAAHLSQTIGLHRDSERWGLSPKMVQRRRILFWDLFVADVWQSLNTGRPPSFSLAYIDCNFPQYEGINVKDVRGVTFDKGKDKDSPRTMDHAAREREKAEKAKKEGYAFEIWQFRFAAECVAEVVSRTLTAEAPTYATIMDLDRKVREFPLPEGFSGSSSSRDPGLGGVPNTHVGGLAEGEGKDADFSTSFIRCVLEHIRETILMYIHRSFFAQAIIEQPINPLKSTYAPSFLAAYRAAATILKSVREQFSMWPTSCARFWTMWTFAFSAAVVFGTVVTRGPHSPLASSAMTELDQACILFSKAALYSKRATRALSILTTLREKARYALASAQNNDPTMPLSSVSRSGGELWNIKREEVDPDDELSIFAGHTRFVSAKNRSVTLGGTSNNTSAGSIPLDPSGAPSSGPALGLVQGAGQAIAGTSGYGQASRAPRQPRQIQPSREYDIDRMDMDLDQRMQYEPSDPYDVHRHHQPAYQSAPAPAPAPQIHNPHHSMSSQRPTHQQISLGDSSSGWYEQDSHSRRDSYAMRSHPPPPPTISIPPASSSIEDPSPHSSHMQFSYSYDRSSRHAITQPQPPSAGYSSWSTQEPPQQQYSHPRHSSSPVRLTHPQYGPPQSQMQTQPSMQSYHHHPHTHQQPSIPQHEVYTGPGGYGPPPPLHAIHGPGNAALADLGLASRDSRLDERWSSFMQDSGLLDEVNFGRGR